MKLFFSILAGTFLASAIQFNEPVLYGIALTWTIGAIGLPFKNN